jgi:hypothetical protein
MGRGAPMERRMSELRIQRLERLHAAIEHRLRAMRGSTRRSRRAVTAATLPGRARARTGARSSRAAGSRSEPRAGDPPQGATIAAECVTPVKASVLRSMKKPAL